MLRRNSGQRAKSLEAGVSKVGWVGRFVEKHACAACPRGKPGGGPTIPRFFKILRAGPRLGVVQWQKFKGAILSPCEGAQTRVPVACACARAFPPLIRQKRGHILRSPWPGGLDPLRPLHTALSSGQFRHVRRTAPHRTTAHVLEEKTGKSPEAWGA